jgi:hypothetical protein
MQVLPFLVLLLGFPVLLRAFLAFDALVILERDSHPDEWERDGKPRPMFRRIHTFPSSLRSGIAAQRGMMVWVFRPPAWATADATARMHLRRLRRTVAFWNLALFPLFLLSALAAAR